MGSGTEAVDLDRTGKYVVYYESSSVADSPNQVYLIPVRLTNTATGATITPDAPFGNRSDGKIKILTYDQDGHKGVAMWQFDVAQAGTYKVESIPGPRTASDGVLAFGPSIESGVVAGGLLVVVGILAVVAALVTLVVGLVRRRRHKRQLRTAGPYGAAPGGYGAPGGYEPYEPGGPQPPPTEQPPDRPGNPDPRRTASRRLHGMCGQAPLMTDDDNAARHRAPQRAVISATTRWSSWQTMQTDVTADFWRRAAVVAEAARAT